MEHALGVVSRSQGPLSERGGGLHPLIPFLAVGPWSIQTSPAYFWLSDKCRGLQARHKWLCHCAEHCMGVQLSPAGKKMACGARG